MVLIPYRRQSWNKVSGIRGAQSRQVGEAMVNLGESPPNALAPINTAGPSGTETTLVPSAALA